MAGDNPIEGSRDDRYAQWATSVLWHTAGTAELTKRTEVKRSGSWVVDIIQRTVEIPCEVAFTPHPRAQDAMRRSRPMTTDQDMMFSHWAYTRV